MSLQIYNYKQNYGHTSTLWTSFLSLIRIVCTNSFANMPLHNPAKSIYRIYPPLNHIIGNEILSPRPNRGLSVSLVAVK